MQYIPLELAQADMVLAKEVKCAHSPAGPPICGKGVVLTLSLIMRLRNMGVQQICIEGHPIWRDGDKTLDEQLASLDHRFRKVENHPLMATIKELYRKQIRRGWETGNE